MTKPKKDNRQQTKPVSYGETAKTKDSPSNETLKNEGHQGTPPTWRA